MGAAERVARGVVFVHSCPRALIPHVEWAIQRADVQWSQPIEWGDQPITTGLSRCEVSWKGPNGSAAKIASALRGFPNLRFEVTEDRIEDLGERFCFTPSLGMYRASTAHNGDIVVGEERLRGILGGEDVREGLARALGQPWDDELEAFRMAGDASVRWLTRVG